MICIDSTYHLFFGRIYPVSCLERFLQRESITVLPAAGAYYMFSVGSLAQEVVYQMFFSHVTK